MTAVTIVAYLLGIIFILSGGAKLSGAEMVMTQFQMWGFPIWFMYVVGCVEVAGGVMLFLRRTRFAAVLVLSVVMVGAIGTHLLYDRWQMALTPLVLLLALAWVASRTRPIRVRPEMPHPEKKATTI